MASASPMLYSVFESTMKEVKVPHVKPGGFSAGQQNVSELSLCFVPAGAESFQFRYFV